MERRIQIASVVMTALLLFSTVFAAVTAQRFVKAAHTVDELDQLKHESYLLADEFRQSGDDLTRLARTYALTGQGRFEEQYHQVLAIRNGDQPRPADYHHIYWDFIAAGMEVSDDTTAARSLTLMMKDKGFTEAELAKLEEAALVAERVVAMDIEAMNAVRGVYRDPQGNYTLRDAPNRQLARRLLHSDAYHEEKARSLLPLDEFYKLIEDRLDSAIAQARATEDQAAGQQAMALSVMGLTSLAVGVFLLVFCIRPLSKLTIAMRQLADGATETRIPYQESRTEFGVLARQINDYKAASDKIAEMGEVEKQRKKEVIAQRESALVLQAQVDEAVGLALDGDFSSRIDIDAQDPSAGKIADRVNTLMDRLDAATAELVEALNALGSGDVERRLSLVGGGRFRELEHTGETARQRLGELIGLMSENAEKERANSARMQAQKEQSDRLQVEIDEMIAQAQDGAFDKRIAIPGCDDSTARIADGMNRLIEGYDHTIEELIAQFTALGQGDLTRELGLEARGRFGELQHTADRTRQLLIALIASVHDSAEQVHDSVNRLRMDATTVSGSMQNQAASIEQTSAAAKEMTKAIKDNAVSLTDASELANAVDHSAIGGAETVASVVAAVEEIKSRSDKIADIVSIIENISFQTNLLALNATVEAARAGEAGRGFAVVASEVRNLSLRASDAATDIAGLINATTQSVDHGVVLAHEAGTALTTISDDMAKLREKIESVSTSGRDQAMTFHEVELAISEISKATQTSAASAERSAELSDALVDTAETLRETLAQFQRPRSVRAAA